MSISVRLRLILVVAAVASTLLVAGPASADELGDCIDKGTAQGIELPSCVVNEDGTMTPQESDGFSSDSGFGPDDGFGIPGWFIAFFVVALVGGIATTYWRVQVARKLATSAGMDPDTAAGMTLLEDDGLTATYLASSLRTPASSRSGSATERLNELKHLLDGGLITQVEYDERRKAVVDSL